MEFRLLGPVEVLEDGEPLPLGGPKQRALLALLLLHANDPVSRDALIDGLWGSRPPRSAGHMVDDYVSRLRKQVGAQRVVRKAPGYKLLVEPGELDLDRFDEFALRGRAALAAGRHAEASTRLTEALAVWRGTALVDVVFEPFASVESARLEELRTGVLEDRFEADLARGGGEELVPELEAAVREQPLRERLVGELMLALYRSGRQTAALEAYRALRHRLADELGLEPSPQLRELERRILEHDPTLASTRPAAVPWPRRRRHLVAGGAALFAALAVCGISRPLVARRLVRVGPAGAERDHAAVAGRAHRAHVCGRRCTDGCGARPVLAVGQRRERPSAAAHKPDVRRRGRPRATAVGARQPRGRRRVCLGRRFRRCLASTHRRCDGRTDRAHASAVDSWRACLRRGQRVGRRPSRQDGFARQSGDRPDRADTEGRHRAVCDRVRRGHALGRELCRRHGDRSGSGKRLDHRDVERRRRADGASLRERFRLGGERAGRNSRARRSADRRSHEHDPDRIIAIGARRNAGERCGSRTRTRAP